jgi:hypothetical protein
LLFRSADSTRKKAFLAHDRRMSRHSHPTRRHTSRRRSVWPLRLLLLVLALPGAIALTSLFWLEPAGRFLLVSAIALSALLAILCGALMTGRLAAAIYNVTSLWAGRSDLEKLMRERQRGERLRPFSPHPLA